jgi:hypothetical protein
MALLAPAPVPVSIGAITRLPSRKIRINPLGILNNIKGKLKTIIAINIIGIKPTKSRNVQSEGEIKGLNTNTKSEH